MKKSLIIIFTAVLPLMGFAQGLFDKYEDLDNVTAVVVNKSMFNLLSKIDVEIDDPEAKDFMDIAISISNLKVFTTEDKAVTSDMAISVSKYVKLASLEELMRINDEEANVKFYTKKGKDDDHVSELLMFITGIKNVEAGGRNFETVLLSITGDIDLNKIGSLTNKMNLPEELKKARKTIK